MQNHPQSHSHPPSFPTMPLYLVVPSQSWTTWKLILATCGHQLNLTQIEPQTSQTFGLGPQHNVAQANHHRLPSSTRYARHHQTIGIVGPNQLCSDIAQSSATQTRATLKCWQHSIDAVASTSADVVHPQTRPMHRELRPQVAPSFQPQLLQ